MKEALVIPPESNFLKVLAGYLLELHGRELRSATVVFPTKRAATYFLYWIWRLSGATVIPPKVYSFGEFVSELSSTLRPLREALSEERAYLLYTLTKELPGFERISRGFERFLPWGKRLSELFEEFVKEGVVPRDLLYPPEDLPEVARTLLSHLGRLYQGYERILEDRGVTTSGFRLKDLLEATEDLFPEPPCYLCGFFLLTELEKRLFERLLAKGADLVFEGDPESLPEPVEELLLRFNLRPRGLSPVKSARRPKLKFYVCSDVHQECREAVSLVPRRVSSPAEVLMLLPVSSHLLPLLYLLPEDLEVNITLGYPLRRSNLASFLLLLVDLVENRLEERYSVSLYLSFLKHPLLREAFGELGLALREAERRLREHGSPYLSLREIEEVSGLKVLGRLNEELLKPLETIKTPREFSSILEGVLRLVTSPFKERLRKAESPADVISRHFLWSVETEVLPVFRDSELAEEPMGQRAVFNMFRETISSARAPFEGHPLRGLQVMGLLETRLLSFKKTVILDANEGALPSAEEPNPLLPRYLRPALGLSQKSPQEAIERHHFERLIRASEEVHIFYLSVSEPSSLQPPKVRSRYVEALLWEEEKRLGKPEADSVLVRFPVVLKPSSPGEGIPRREEDFQLVRRLLSQEAVSPTLLETYLDCPVKFYFRYLLKLSPPSTIGEYDPRELGIVVHASLQRYFSPFLGRRYDPLRDNDAERLVKLFEEEFEKSVLSKRLGPERRFFVVHTARYRLTQYLSALREVPPFEVVMLEKPLEREVPSVGIRVRGVVDRVDRYGDSLVILDYKTGGSVRSLSLKRLEELLKTPKVDFPPDRGGLLELKELMPDLQLMTYLLLEEEAEDAVYVHLATGRRSDLFKSVLYRAPFLRESSRSLSRENAEVLKKEVFPALFKALLRHMLSSEVFFVPEPPPNCKFCDYLYACRYARPTA